MKKLLVCFLAFVFFISPVYAADLQLPDYTGFVNDYEGILNNKDELEAKLSAFEKETSVEIAIVTTPDFQGTTIEDYAVKLFEKWKIGKAKLDNGLLIIVSSKQRQSRFEVGYGLEGTLPDALTGRIQDEFMIPYFKDGDYAKGIVTGLDETIAIIKKDPTAISVNDTKRSTSDSAPEWLFSIIIIGIYIMAATRSWWFGGIFGGVIGFIWALSNGVWLLPIFFAIIGFVVDFILSKTFIGQAIMTMARYASTSSGSSGGGGGVSFGGGRSGGGGSSRSW